MTRVSFPVCVGTVENHAWSTHDMKLQLDVTLDVQPPTTAFQLIKGRVEAATWYEVDVPDIAAFGIAWNDGDVEGIANDLVLALNFASERAVFTRAPPDKKPIALARKAPPPPPPATSKEGNTVSIHAELGVAMSVSAAMLAQTNAEVDSSKVMAIFQRIRAARAANTPTSSLALALDNMVEAAGTWQHLGAIEHYHKAAEFATNNGIARHAQLDGAALDARLSTVSAIPEPHVKLVRIVANRAKHAHGSPNHEAEFAQAMGNPAARSRDARLIARAAILGRI